MRFSLWIQIPLQSDAGIRCLRSGGFDTYTLSMTATGFRLAGRESGSRELGRQQANRLEARLGWRIGLQSKAAGPACLCWAVG